MSSALPIVHQSDLSSFRRCRRRWDITSYQRQNFEPIDRTSKHLWFGSAFHFALEDLHGVKNFPSAWEAFQAYSEATPDELIPDEHGLLMEMGQGMLSYYEKHWLPRRNDMLYPVYKGGPTVEVNFAVPIIDPRDGQAKGTLKGVFDGLCRDAYGRLWVVEYKTAIQFDINKLSLDFQTTAYTYAACQMFGKSIEGVMYLQFYKGTAEAPEELKRGGISVKQNQRTTHALYKEALIRTYGSWSNVPLDTPHKAGATTYREYLEDLELGEDENGDRLIRRDFVRRTPEELRTFALNTCEQLEDMCSPTVYLYPNPTKDCSWDCDAAGVCMSMMDGGDWESLLQETFKIRTADQRTIRATVFERLKKKGLVKTAP